MPSGKAVSLQAEQRRADLALIDDRKFGRPKKSDEGESASAPAMKTKPMSDKKGRQEKDCKKLKKGTNELKMIFISNVSLNVSLKLSAVPRQGVKSLKRLMAATGLEPVT